MKRMLQKSLTSRNRIGPSPPTGDCGSRTVRVIKGGKVGVLHNYPLLRFNGAVERDPAISAWMKKHDGELGAIALQWFEVMRRCGDEVRELLHDGCATAC